MAMGADLFEQHGEGRGKALWSYYEHARDNDLYLAYERSLAGTLGTLYIFYDLSRRITVRAQTGEQSAIDLIFTVPYD